jgi:hypothetical protein
LQIWKIENPKKKAYAVGMFGSIQLGVQVAMYWPAVPMGPDRSPWRELMGVEADGLNFPSGF